jgi:predicted MFS family arabinose efflux permease
MTSTTDRLTIPVGSAADRLPWPSLLVLGAATLLMVTTEMLPTAVLTPMSLGLGVTEARTAQLVSLWAAVVVIASFPLVRLTRRFDRRSVIGVGMVALAGSSALTAAAPSYLAAVGGRLAGAVAVGLLWATVNAHVADLVSDRLLGPAIAVVLGGATLGMVIGTPVARMVADVAGWRSAFGVVALVAAVVAILVRVAVASAGPTLADPISRRRPARPLRPMLLTTGLVGLLLVGHYSAYTFITRLAEAPAQLVPGQVSGLLLAFGLASAVGVSLAGRTRVPTSPALVVAAASTAAAVLGLALADRHAGAGLGVVVVWGVVSGALPPLAQTEIFRLAGPEHRATAGAVIPVVFNGGIAVGAALAAQLVADHGVGALPVPAAAVVAAAALGLTGAAWSRRRTTAKVGNSASSSAITS